MIKKMLKDESDQERGTYRIVGIANLRMVTRGRVGLGNLQSRDMSGPD